MDAWTLDLRASGASDRYVGNVSDLLSKFRWWQTRRGADAGGSAARFDEAGIREFLLYVRTSHTLPEGRWGEPGTVLRSGRGKTPVSDGTVRDYWRILRTFSNWLLAQHILSVSPIAGVRQPIARKGPGFHVFTPEEIRRLLEAAKHGPSARRDTALVLFLLDTGVRASELTQLVWADIDAVKSCARVVGKGNKVREVWWSKDTRQALWAYAQEVGTEPDAAVFASDCNRTRGEAMARGGMRKIIVRLGAAARVSHAHPHTFRHTFATAFLLAGGDPMVLMDLMGHSTLAMTRRYLRFTGADLAGQARRYSPVAYLKRKTG